MKAETLYVWAIWDEDSEPTVQVYVNLCLVRQLTSIVVLVYHLRGFTINWVRRIGVAGRLFYLLVVWHLCLLFLVCLFSLYSFTQILFRDLLDRLVLERMSASASQICSVCVSIKKHVVTEFHSFGCPHDHCNRFRFH